MSDADKIRGAERAAADKPRTQGIIDQVTSTSQEIKDHNEGFDKTKAAITEQKIAKIVDKAAGS